MRADLPTGTVTFLFTDIEGSTRLLHELGADDYANQLAEHRRVLREAFERNGGVEVDGQGDALFVAFPTAPGALAAAREAQEALLLPVRMGLHTGTPLLTEEGYVGADVHRAARIAAAGHGRQVLVSTTTAALVDREGLRDLGEHRLKDLSAAERIFQLGEEEFPRLATLYQTNLPVQPNMLVGRERELAEVEQLVRGGGRLVTFVGAGGAGKTRLALHAAAELVDLFPDGVWFVPLSSVADPALVSSAIERAVEVNDLAELRNRELLVVLDNVEHLLDAAGMISELLAAAPGVCLLATSRERLAINAERVYRVSGLELAAAAELFRQRAGVEDAAAVSAVLSRLEGLPLAIELAAARAVSLPVAELAARLDHALDVLTVGARDAPPRQRTLRATIRWSYDLLTDDERVLFGRLSVFAGGFYTDAVDAVCSGSIDALHGLVEKSLVVRDGERFNLLEPIREFAAEVIDGTDDIRRRHAEYYAGTAEAYDEETPASIRSAPVFARLAPELENLRGAFGWAVSNDGVLAVRLAIIAGWYRMPVAEWHRVCEAASEYLEEVEAATRVRFLLRATYAAKEARDLRRARELYERLGRDARAVGNARAQRLALGGLGDLAMMRGDFAHARSLYEEAIDLADGYDLAGLLNALGEVAARLGDFDDAAASFEEALTVARGGDYARLEAKVLHGIGDLNLRRGNLKAAENAFRESAALGREFHDPKSAVYCLAGLAAIASARGETSRAAGLWTALVAAHDLSALDPEDEIFYAAWLKGVDLSGANRFESLDDAVDAALATD